MAFGNTEERLSQFGNKRQILNAIREHYLMKREADQGSQLFWDRIFWRRGCEGTFPRRGTHGTLFLPVLTVASVSRVQGSRCELPESTSGPVWSSVNYQSRRCQSVPACALKSASNTSSGRTER